MAAHCESGTITTLLNHAGLDISEPMVFGISNGIFFGYFSKQPSFSFPTFIVRNKPGQMRKNIAKRLGVKFETQKFRNPEEAEKALDSLLQQGIPVGVQVDFFYMDYLPAWMRVHINVHYVTIVGKNSSKYIVSDCYYSTLAEIDAETLRKARFPGGMMSPKGFMFHPVYIPENGNMNFKDAIARGIKKSAFYMLKVPIPFLGVKGIQKFSKKVVDWPKYARDTEHLSHEIMKINILLEDQGTGGAGFRFMFATFLRQAYEIFKNEELLVLSKRMMEIGDRWREISLFAVRIGKNRDLGPEKLKQLSEMIWDRSLEEKDFFTDLYKLKL